MSYKSRLQSNSKLNQESDCLVGQSFNLPNLNYYTKDRAWDYHRYFDRTTRSIRQNLLNHYNGRLNYLTTLPESVHPIIINLIKDNIAYQNSLSNTQYGFNII